jgi:hypothetical protein
MPAIDTCSWGYNKLVRLYLVLSGENATLTLNVIHKHIAGTSRGWLPNVSSEELKKFRDVDVYPLAPFDHPGSQSPEFVSHKICATTAEQKKVELVQPVFEEQVGLLTGAICSLHFRCEHWTFFERVGDFLADTRIPPGTGADRTHRTPSERTRRIAENSGSQTARYRSSLNDVNFKS